MERKKDGDTQTTTKHSRKSTSTRWPNLSNVMELFNLSRHATASPKPDKRRNCSYDDSESSLSRSDRSTSSEPDAEDGDVPAVSATTSISGSEMLRMFVGTWNVGGRAPHSGLNLRDWLCTPAPADIYVLGFQEIVPLNAGNILAVEDKGPATTWLSLIGQALNFPEQASTSDSQCRDGGTVRHPDQFRRPRVSFCDLISIEDMLEDAHGGVSGENASSGGFRLAASRQMVGIFLCVWVRGDLLQHVSRTKISCVARGMMGYTGNKGSISISMTLRETTFCFVCAHLASGEKERDEVRRNSDVVEILRRTRFHRSKRRPLPPSLAPKTVLQHSKVIWLGDLNYRLSSSCDDANELLQKNNWGALLEMDQLRNEQKAGRIFTGWEEGRIYFPPTYKYITNSDVYAVQTVETKEKKRRTPAWCDRILWRGEEMKQVCYVRGESRFSDHRPVYSIFSVRVAKAEEEAAAPETAANGKSTRKKKFHKMRWASMARHRNTPTTHDLSSSGSNSSCNNSPNSSSRVQAEEMFPITRIQSFS